VVAHVVAWLPGSRRRTPSPPHRGPIRLLALAELLSVCQLHPPPRRPLRPARTHAWLAGWLRACVRLPLRGVGWTDDTAASRKYEDSCALHDPHQLKLVRAGAESGWGEDVHAVRPYSLDRINPPPPASGSMRVSASRILRSSSTFQKRAYICVFLQSGRDGTPPTIM